jgi:hypothetical protein
MRHLTGLSTATAFKKLHERGMFIMATPVESANLILKLYELRREPLMREARNFVVLKFDPRSVEDYMACLSGPDSAYIRMVASYWEMAASLVVNGAIDPAMFDASAGEHIIVFGKAEPFLAELRAATGPGVYKNLEQVCTSAAGGVERVRATAERIRGMITRAAAASN